MTELRPILSTFLFYFPCAHRSRQSNFTVTLSEGELNKRLNSNLNLKMFFLEKYMV